MNFFEKVPKPLISTFSSRATASTMDSNIESIASEICVFTNNNIKLKKFNGKIKRNTTCT